MTSSIRLTERMNLFRQQALAPYKKAIWALAGLLLLTIIAFSVVVGLQYNELNKYESRLKTAMNKVDSLEYVVRRNPNDTAALAELEKARGDLSNIRSVRPRVYIPSWIAPCELR